MWFRFQLNQLTYLLYTSFNFIFIFLIFVVFLFFSFFFFRWGTLASLLKVSNTYRDEVHLGKGFNTCMQGIFCALCLSRSKWKRLSEEQGTINTKTSGTKHPRAQNRETDKIISCLCEYNVNDPSKIGTKQSQKIIHNGRLCSTLNV